MPPNNRENKIPYIPDFSPIYFMSVSFSPTDQVALQIVRQGRRNSISKMLFPVSCNALHPKD